MCEVAGNPLSALILQVVAYHNLTLVQSAVEDKTYGEIRSAWELNEDPQRSIGPKNSHLPLLQI